MICYGLIIAVVVVVVQRRWDIVSPPAREYIYITYIMPFRNSVLRALVPVQTV